MNTFQISKVYTTHEDQLYNGRITILSRTRCFIKYVWESYNTTDLQEYRKKIRIDMDGEYILCEQCNNWIIHSMNKDNKMIEEMRDSCKRREQLINMGVLVRQYNYTKQRSILKELRSKSKGLVCQKVLKT